MKKNIRDYKVNGNQFASIDVRKPSFNGFKCLQRCAYELTGKECYLGMEMFYSESKQGKIYFDLISNFWWLKKEIQTLIKSGCFCRYSLIDGNGVKLPYICNRLVF